MADTMVAVGAGIGALAQVKSGIDAKKAGKMNAEIAQANAAEERRVAGINAAKQEREGRMRLGQLRTSTAAAGIELEGSALDVVAESARQEELERQAILSGGAARASSFEQTARVERKTGSAALTTGVLSAGSTLATGLAKV